MEAQKQISSLKKEIEKLELKYEKLEHEHRHTYVFDCPSIWECEECLRKDGVKRDLEAEYDRDQNQKITSRWMECKECGWNDKMPGIIKKYLYKSEFKFEKRK